MQGSTIKSIFKHFFSHDYYWKVWKWALLSHFLSFLFFHISNFIIQLIQESKATHSYCECLNGQIWGTNDLWSTFGKLASLSPEKVLICTLHGATIILGFWSIEYFDHELDEGPFSITVICLQRKIVRSHLPSSTL